MYLFPTVTLPPKAVAEAKKQNEAPDQFYCLAMLHATGSVYLISMFRNAFSLRCSWFRFWSS